MNAQSEIEWRVSSGLTPYPDAVGFMEERVAAIAAGNASEQVWLVEHPPIYTAGTSADDKDLLDPDRFPVFKTGRGGEFTYHGPGQRVGYVLMDLNRRRRDVRQFVRDLEQWMIVTLSTFGVRGERRDGRVGIWIDRGYYGGPPGTEGKIAAIGVRLRRWISFHGCSINVSPTLNHYEGIIPCGISQHGITSLNELGLDTSIADVDRALKTSFTEVFGRDVAIVSAIS
jgi:lipoyl(octanoyl) transferase